MSRPRLIRVLVVSGLLFVAAGVALYRASSSRDVAGPTAKEGAGAGGGTGGGVGAGLGSAAANAAPGLDLGLVIWPGSGDEASVLVLRLWSGDLRQNELDNVALTAGVRRPVEPLVVSIPKESWAQAQFKSGAGAGEALAGAVLVTAPAADKRSIGPRDTLTAQYRIPSASLPAPGTLVRAEVKTARGVLVSEPVPVPPAPETEKGRLLRKAENLLKLGSHTEAVAAADQIIGRYAAEPGGYWIEGQVREAEGKLDEALRLYRTALEKASARADASAEPPTPIILKIRMLEERLAAAKR